MPSSSVYMSEGRHAPLDPRWEDLYERCRAPLYRAAAFLVGDGEGEEIVQDAFERAMKNGRFFDDVREPAAWLRQVVIRLAVTRLRRRAVWKRVRELIARPQSARLPDLRTAIDQLPPSQRGAILLHYYFGASYEEVAIALGLRPASVGKVLARARASLRQALE
jgi:RNA polymerase sigma-70 factor (ECF subfamily)